MKRGILIPAGGEKLLAMTFAVIKVMQNTHLKALWRRQMYSRLPYSAWIRCYACKADLGQQARPSEVKYLFHS